ncbi:putative ribosomal protein L7/L12/adaptor protein ClpS [Helianthus anomalus]
MKCENKSFVTYTPCSEKSNKKREYVVQVLMKVIPGITVDNVVNTMQEAHINGLYVVIVCG